VARASNAPFDALSDLLLAKIEYLVANSGTCAAGQVRREQTRRPIPFLSALVSHWSRTGSGGIGLGRRGDGYFKIQNVPRFFSIFTQSIRARYQGGERLPPPTPPMDD